MPIDNSLDGRQSYARACKLLGRVQPLKHTEQSVGISHVKSGAIVPDINCRFSGAIRLADFYPGVIHSAGKLPGVPQELIGILGGSHALYLAGKSYSMLRRP